MSYNCVMLLKNANWEDGLSYLDHAEGSKWEKVLFVGLWLLYIGIKMLKRVTFYKLDAYLLSNIFVIFDFVYSSKQVDCGDTFNIDYWFVAFHCLSIVSLSLIKALSAAAQPQKWSCRPYHWWSFHCTDFTWHLFAVFSFCLELFCVLVFIFVFIIGKM